MQKTETYKLNLIDGGDDFSPAPLNENARLVEAALKALPRCAAGSYVGTGTYGADSPCSMTFDFEPKILIIMTDAESSTFPAAIFVRGMSHTQGPWHDTDFKLEMHMSWSGNTVSWYSTRNTMSDYAQMNRINQSYSWFAMG